MPPRSRSPAASDPTSFIGRFLMLDDDADYAAHIGARLRELRPVDVARSISEADRLLAGPHPHVGLVIDLVLPDGNGLVYLGQLRARGRHAPALVLTGAETLDHVVHRRADSLRASLLHKDDEVRSEGDFWARVDRLGEDALAEEERAVGPRAALFVLSDGALTPTEMRVAELGLEYATDEVAEELGMARRTARNHVSSILAKCGGSGRGLVWLREMATSERRRSRRRRTSQSKPRS